jgi:hypothetical protein
MLRHEGVPVVAASECSDPCSQAPCATDGKAFDCGLEADDRQVVNFVVGQYGSHGTNSLEEKSPAGVKATEDR